MEELRSILTTPGLEAYHDEARGWLYTRWLGQHTEVSIAQAITAVCACLRQHSYTRILSDHSSLAGKWPAESPWLMQLYFDALAAQGVVYFAWVYNKDYCTRAMMTQVIQGIEHPIVSLFEDVASAYEWLARCPELPAVRVLPRSPDLPAEK